MDLPSPPQIRNCNLNFILSLFVTDMDSLERTTATAAATTSSSGTPPPSSAELMLALSQIQQLIPLLDYRPGGLTHLLPTLLTPLLPNDAAAAESVQRYRANVDHAFRVAAELVGRVNDSASVGNALNLAETLMREGDEKARLLRVRKKRRLFVEQEKVLEANHWGPPVPSRVAVASKIASATESKQEAEQADQKPAQITAFLPSQNPTKVMLSPAQQNLPSPTHARAVQSYLIALHSYLQLTVEKGLAPPTVALKQVRARILAFAPGGFTLEVQVAQVMKACIEANLTFVTKQQAERQELLPLLQSVDVAALTLGAVNESIVSTTPPATICHILPPERQRAHPDHLVAYHQPPRQQTSTTPSAYPIFRSLATEILAHTHRALSPSLRNNDTLSSTDQDSLVWLAYKPITETVTRLILAAAQLQA